MTKLLRTTALSALALLFVACDTDEALTDLGAEIEVEARDEGLVVHRPLAADLGDDDGPADPTPFFDLDRLDSEDPGCATGGEQDLDLVGVAVDPPADPAPGAGVHDFVADHVDPGPLSDEGFDLVGAGAVIDPLPGDDLDLVADLGGVQPDPGAEDPELELAGAVSNDDQVDEDEDELDLVADQDDSEDTSGWEPTLHFTR
ncbi:MAG: hypothetical protein R3B09_01965 [Nannocystaceae bacterium]